MTCKGHNTDHPFRGARFFLFRSPERAWLASLRCPCHRSPARIRAMTPSQTTPDDATRPEPFRWNRIDTTEVLHDFLDPRRPNPSQRHLAQQAGVTRSTLQHYLGRQRRLNLDPAVAGF